jgi:hypothetical protein
MGRGVKTVLAKASSKLLPCSAISECYCKQYFHSSSQTTPHVEEEAAFQNKEVALERTKIGPWVPMGSEIRNDCVGTILQHDCVGMILQQLTSLLSLRGKIWGLHVTVNKNDKVLELL